MTATVVRETLPQRNYFYRHSVIVRVTHWVNVALHDAAADERPADLQRPSGALLAARSRTSTIRCFSMGAAQHADGQPGRRHPDRRPRVRHHGRARSLASWTAATTARGFPAWITIPCYQDLATGRRWHFFFAWVFVHQRPRLPRSTRRQRPLAAISCRRATQLRHIGTLDPRAPRACASRRARRRSATTCCRSSPTSA